MGLVDWIQKIDGLTLSPEVRDEKNAKHSNGIRFEMVLIPAGKFMMGSPSPKKDLHDTETLHQVNFPFVQANLK